MGLPPHSYFEEDPDNRPDCDGLPLRDEHHMWSENVVVRIYANPESEGVHATLNGDLKHCEKCGAVRWYPARNAVELFREAEELIDKVPDDEGEKT